MKKIFTFLCFIFLANIVLAQISESTFEMKTDNFRQIDETTIEWELWLKKAGGDDFGLYTWHLQWEFDNELLNGGEFEWANFVIFPGEDAVFMGHYSNAQATAPFDPQGKQIFNYTPNVFPDTPGQDMIEITEDWKHIATYRAQLTKNGDPHNFASMDPKFAHRFNGVVEVFASETPYVLDTEVQIQGTITTAGGVPINERQLAGYYFTGDGDWTDTDRWNNVTVENANTLPTANANAIINGNATIPDDLEVSLLPDIDGNGGELSLWEGEERLYILTLTSNVSTQGVGLRENHGGPGDPGDWLIGPNATGINSIELSEGWEGRLYAFDNSFGANFWINWTDDDGGTYPDQSGQDFTMPNKDITITANWTSKNTSNHIIDDKKGLDFNNTRNRNLFSSLTISPGATLTVDKLFNDHPEATREEAILLLSPENHDPAGSLIHNNPGAHATIQRYIEQHGFEFHEGWHFLSSPVKEQEIRPEFFPADDTDPDYALVDFYRWDEKITLNDEIGWWINIKGSLFADPNAIIGPQEPNLFTEGRGYLMAYGDPAQAPKEYGGRIHTFAGEINVEGIPVNSLTYTGGIYVGWHFLGNPYASALAWNDGDGWNTNNIQGGPQIWISEDRDYRPVVNEVIPAMNGFMIQATEDGNGSLTIPPANRVHSEKPWFKLNHESDHIRLVANDLQYGTAKTSIVIFREDAEEGIDQKYDTYYMAGYGPRFYAMVEDAKLSVNALPNYYDGLTINFGFTKNEASQFNLELVNTLEAFQHEGLMLLLDDLKLAKTHNLTETPVYEFTSHEDDHPARFQLRVTDVSTDITDPSVTQPVHAWYHNQMLHVKAFNPGTNVSLYDINGRELQSFIADPGQNSYRLHLPTGVYLVRIIDNQKMHATKIVVH